MDTSTSILEVAERLVRGRIRPDLIESINVREDEDWSGDPSLFVDVFLAPDAEAFDTDTLTDIRLRLTQELLAHGERRFAYMRFRDRLGEEEEESPAEQT